MQLPPQLTWLALHVTTHAPLRHTVPAPQAAPTAAPVHVPVAPQNIGFVFGSMHAPPQNT